ILMWVHTALAGKDASLRLKVQHGFRTAPFSMWIDGDLAYSGKLIGSPARKFFFSSRRRHTRSRLSMFPTTPTTLGVVCPVGYGNSRNRTIKRWPCCTSFRHFIRVNNTRRPIERTGLARCASNETHTAGAQAGTADPV